MELSVDQGGCVETSRPTNYDDPSYLCHQVIHFCVTNIPVARPRTASQALSAAIAGYVMRLAEGDWRDEPNLRRGVNLE